MEINFRILNKNQNRLWTSGYNGIGVLVKHFLLFYSFLLTFLIPENGAGSPR
jgi:hypothetical protein